MTQTINSQQLLRGDIYTELVDVTLNGSTGSATWTSKLAKPLVVNVTLYGSSTPSAETFCAAVSGRTVTVYSSLNTSTSRVYVIVKGYRLSKG